MYPSNSIELATLRTLPYSLYISRLAFVPPDRPEQADELGFGDGAGRGSISEGRGNYRNSCIIKVSSDKAITRCGTTGGLGPVRKDFL